MNDRRLPTLLITCLLATGCPDRDKAPTSPPAGTKGKARPATKSAAAKAQCKTADQCTFRRKGCCYQCRETPLSQIEAMTAEQEKVKDKVCAIKAVKCDPCKQGRGFNANFVELCEAGKCVVKDIRETPFSACAKDGDCRLATKICCNCYGEPVAVGAKGEQAFHAWKCSEGQSCEPCDAPDHVGLSVKCVKGHCVIEGTWDKAKERPSIRGFIK